MTTMRYAELMWVVTICMLSIYEIYALATGQTTLSRVVWTAQRSQYGPLLPFLAGLLCGHFFWSGR